MIELFYFSIEMYYLQIPFPIIIESEKDSKKDGDNMIKKNTSLNRQLFSITWPILIECSLFLLLGNMDVFMLGKYSDTSVGAVGIVNQLVSMLQLMFSIITNGTSIICAQYIGAKKSSDEKNRLIGSAILFNLVTGLLISLVLCIGYKPLLTFMHTDAVFMPDASIYLRIVGGCLFLQALTNTFSAILRAHGRTKICMFTTIVINLINVTGNAVLIFGLGPAPRLGVEGAAISTSFSRLISTIVLGIVLFKTCLPDFSFSCFHGFPKKEIRSILSLGLPAAGEQISYNLAKTTTVIILTYIGTSAVTANSYLSSITSFIYIFSASIAQGTSIMVGWLAGENKKKEAYSLVMRSFCFGFTASMIMSVIFLFGGHWFLSFLTSDKEILALGNTIFLLNFITEAGRCANLVFINSLRATGDVNYPVIVGVFSMWLVAVLFSYLFGLKLGLGLPGVWLALGLDECVRGVFMFFRWRRFGKSSD